MTPLRVAARGVVVPRTAWAGYEEAPGDLRWIGRITVNGTPRAVSARTKTEARYEFDNLRRAAEDGVTIPDATMTVADLLELWEDEALPNRNLYPSRIDSHQWAIRILTGVFDVLRHWK